MRRVSHHASVLCWALLFVPLGAVLSSPVLAEPLAGDSAAGVTEPSSSPVQEAASSAMIAERDWVLITDKDGVTVYRAHTDDSPIKTFRGETDVELEDFRSIGTIMDDYDFVSSWLHMVSEIEGFSRVSPYHREVWLTTRLPWPVADRDVVIEVLVEQDPETYAVRMPFREVERIEKKDGYVRIPRMQGYLEFTPIEPGRIHLTIEVILDPGGRLPAWLANLILRDIPYFSLKNFRNVANTERYQGVDLGYFEIPAGWPGSKTSAADIVSRTAD